VLRLFSPQAARVVDRVLGALARRDLVAVRAALDGARESSSRPGA
jgi:hypothetical protein